MFCTCTEKGAVMVFGSGSVGSVQADTAAAPDNKPMSDRS